MASFESGEAEGALHDQEESLWLSELKNLECVKMGFMMMRQAQMTPRQLSRMVYRMGRLLFRGPSLSKGGGIMGAVV